MKASAWISCNFYFHQIKNKNFALLFSVSMASWPVWINLISWQIIHIIYEHFLNSVIYIHIKCCFLAHALILNTQFISMFPFKTLQHLIYFIISAIFILKCYSFFRSVISISFSKNVQVTFLPCVPLYF